MIAETPLPDPDVHVSRSHSNGVPGSLQVIRAISFSTQQPAAIGQADLVRTLEWVRQEHDRGREAPHQSATTPPSLDFSRRSLVHVHLRRGDWNEYVKPKKIVLGVFACAMVTGLAFAQGFKNIKEFLTGCEEVPSVSTPAGGEFTATIRKDNTIDWQLRYRISPAPSSSRISTWQRRCQRRDFCLSLHQPG